MHNQLCYILGRMCASASLVLKKIACLCAVLIPPAFYYVHLSVLFLYVIVSLDATIIITVHTGHKVSPQELK